MGAAMKVMVSKHMNVRACSSLVLPCACGLTHIAHNIVIRIDVVKAQINVIASLLRG